MKYNVEVVKEAIICYEVEARNEREVKKIIEEIGLPHQKVKETNWWFEGKGKIDKIEKVNEK